MNGKRSTRCLSALRDASSARVLNLAAIERQHREEKEYHESPLFEAPPLNSAIILKHRLRADETYLFEDPQPNATKIVIPYDKNDLRLGGVSFFYGQRGFLEMMREGCKYSARSMERDLRVLSLIDQLPSLDPFLLHEQLVSSGIYVADCYFELSKADKARMHEFVANEIRDLIGLATRDSSGLTKGGASSTARLVSALLTAGAEEQLEPLRLTLMLEDGDFRRGVFSWRGFLYYKWCAKDLLPKISAVAKEIGGIRVTRVSRNEELQYIVSVKRQLLKQINLIVRDVDKTLAVYDSFYADLVRHGQPRSFREFLMRAPDMFSELGEKIGGLGHITSFWRYRFPRRTIAPVDAEHLTSIFHDFMVSAGISLDDALDSATSSALVAY